MSLQVRLRYDDGFVLYLNGQRLAGGERPGRHAVEFPGDDGPR